MGIKYAVNEGFFDAWSRKMAYVLGYIYADGAIYKSSRGSYLAITSTDKSTIVKIKKWMNSAHRVVEAEPSGPNGKQRFILRIGNKYLYDALTKLGVHPSKSLTMEMPNVPSKFLQDFTRGYFDGDGCANLYRTKGITQDLIVRKLSVIFTSGSKKFLQELLDILSEKVDLKQKLIYNSHRSFQLRLATADSIEFFRFLYEDVPQDLFLRRKFDVFLKYFKLRPQKIDNSIESILECHM